MQIRLDQILKCSNTWEWDGTEIVDNHNDSLPNVHLRPGKSGLQQGWWWLGTEDDDLNDDNDEDDDNDDDDDDIYIMVKCLYVTFLLISFSLISRHFWV